METVQAETKAPRDPMKDIVIPPGVTPVKPVKDKDNTVTERVAKINAMIQDLAKQQDVVPEDILQQVELVLSIDESSYRYAFSDVDNPRMRQQVEKRLEEIDVDFSTPGGRITQTVSIVPGKLTVMFQSVSLEEDDYLRDLYSVPAAITMEFMNSNPRSARKYFQGKFIMGVCKINNEELVEHMMDGKVEDKKYHEKEQQVRRYNVPFIELMVANYNWFEDRLRKATVYQALKKSSETPSSG